jgi:hypothetical protein
MDTLLKMLEEKIQARQKEEESIAQAWEAGHGNRLVLFFRAARQILLRPTLFFASLRELRVRPALVFGAVVSTVAILAAFAYALWNLQSNREELVQWVRTHSTVEDPDGFLSGIELFMRVMLYGSPLWGVLNVLVMAGLYHLGIRLTGREHRGFRATLLATAYGFLPALLAVIPSRIGLLIGSTWPLILQALGLAVLHRVPVVRGALAVLMPALALALLTLPLLSS